MTKLLGWPVTLCFVASLSFAQHTGVEKWNSFHSNAGFSVEYPASWFPKGVSKDRLMILSSRGGAEAVVIKHGQAVISVMAEKQYLDSALSQVIGHYSVGTEVLSRSTIHSDRAGNRGCRDLEEVSSKESAVPPESIPGPVPYIINTEYFCEVNRHKYVTVLRNFEGDKKQRMYQQVALRIAESLRVDE